MDLGCVESRSSRLSSVQRNQWIMTRKKAHIEASQLMFEPRSSLPIRKPAVKLGWWFVHWDSGVESPQNRFGLLRVIKPTLTIYSNMCPIALCRWPLSVRCHMPSCSIQIYTSSAIVPVHPRQWTESSQPGRPDIALCQCPASTFPDRMRHNLALDDPNRQTALS